MNPTPVVLSALSPTAAALAAAYPPGIHADLVRALALHGVGAEQIHFHASDVRVSCHSAGLAHTLKSAGQWRSMADVYRTNPEHPDAKRWPWGVDVPFARLDHLVNEKRAGREVGQ